MFTRFGCSKYAVHKVNKLFWAKSAIQSEKHPLMRLRNYPNFVITKENNNNNNN